MSEQQAPAIRADVTVLTPDNFNQYVDEKMGIKTPDPLEVQAEEELKAVEAEKAERIAAQKAEEDPTHDAHELPEEKKNGINERFKKLSSQKKAAEEAASKAISEAKAEAEKAAKEAQALRDKYEPKKTEQDPEPQPHQFTDIAEYTKAVKDWSADNALRQYEKQQQENAQKVKQEAAMKVWQDRQAAVKTAIPDYAETLAGSDVTVSDQLKEAIIDSDVGPQALYYLAKNPDIAKEMAEMSIPKALIRFGKIEASLMAETTKSTTPALKIAEISKAPAPISPLKGASSIPGNKIDDKGEFIGTYDDYKKLRMAGKIK